MRRTWKPPPRSWRPAAAVRDAPPRPGDPAILVADSSRIRSALGWLPQHDDLDVIVRTALAFERSLPRPD